MRTDAELLRDYAERHDQAAFAELVERHVGLVYNVALRRLNGNGHLAEEAVQLVFTQLAEKAHRLAAHPTILGWLHTGTRYAAHALIRRETRRAVREHLAATMPPESSDAIPWESLRPALDGALDRLSPVDRQALLLRFFAGRSFAEIGAELGVSEEASRKRVQRALDQLRWQFAKRGISTSAAALAAALAEAPLQAAPAGLASTVAASATGAAASATSVPALLGLMSTAKIFTTVSAVALATVATGLFTWSQAQKRAQQQLNAADAQAAAIHAKLLQLERARVSAAAPASNGSAAASRAKPVNAFVQRSLQARSLLLNSREYAPFRRQGFVLQVQHDFGDYLASRNFSADKLERVRKALETYYAQREDEAFAFSLAEPGTTPKRAELIAGLAEAMFAALRPELGDGETDRLHRYFAAQELAWVAQSAGLDMADAGIPMTRLQQMSLAMVVADANAVTDETTKNAREAVDPRTGLSAENRTELDDASAFLSPAQLKLFEEFLRQNRTKSALISQAGETVARMSP